jgi:hypothetical protein
MRKIFGLLTVITVMLVLAFGTITTFMARTNDTIEVPPFEASIEWTGEVWELSLYVNGENFTLDIGYILAVAEPSDELNAVAQLLRFNYPIEFLTLSNEGVLLPVHRH